MSTTPTSSAPPTTAFLSYAHRTAVEDDEVLALANRLRADGVAATIDRYAPHPSEGWGKWMEKQFDGNQFIFLIISKKYIDDFNQVKNNSSGARYEGVAFSNSPPERGRFPPYFGSHHAARRQR